MCQEAQGTHAFENDLDIQRGSLRKLLNKQKKQDADYYNGEIGAAVYNRLSENIDNEISQCKVVIAGVL